MVKTSRPGPTKRDDPSVIAMVTRAAGSDQSAWNEIVERYAPLVWSICSRFQLGNQDSEDVGQTVWLLLVEHLGELREPAALPGWLAKTTARECLRVVTAAYRSERVATRLDDAEQFVDGSVIDEEILLAERNAGLRTAFAELPPPLPAAAGHAPVGSACLLRGNQRGAGHTGRKHRAAARPLPRTAAQVPSPRRARCG